MALNTYALRIVKARKHWVNLNGHARKKTSFRGCDQFTFEAWIKVGAGATSPDQRCYVESQTESVSKIRFACAPTRENNRSILRFEVCRKDGGTPTSYTYVLPQPWDDRWHHVAFSGNLGKRQYSLYYDGVQVQKGTLSGGGTYKEENSDNENEKPYMMGGDIQNTQDEDGNEVENEDKYIPKAITIGACYGPSGKRIFWDGKIDNIRVWKSYKGSATFGEDMFDQTDDYATNSNLLEEWRFNEGPNQTSNQGGSDNSDATDEDGTNDDLVDVFHG